MMKLRFDIRYFLGAGLATALLFVLACGASEEATPTPVPPTPTIQPPPPLVTATPTPAAVDTPTPPPAADQPKYGGSVSISVTSQGSFDPYHLDSQFRWTTLGSVGNVWGQLLRVNPTDRVTVEGDLVESWTTSADGTEWVLKLREGVTDHGGEPFTAEDAFWQIIRIVERPNGVHGNYQGCMRTFIKPVWDDNGNPVADGGAEITGPMELTIRLKAPRGAFVACFTSGFQSAQPSRIVKPIDTAAGGEYRDLRSDEVVGYGPFMFKDFQQDTFVTWERNPDYFRDGRPYLDEVTMLVIPDAATRTASFRANRIDMFRIFETMSKRDADALVAEGDAVFPIVLAMGWRGAELNAKKPPFGPLDDPDAKLIRQAVQMTVDRGAVNDLSKDGIGHIALPYFIGWTWIRTPDQWFEALPGFDPDPMVKEGLIAEAQGIMEGLGYGPDNRISVNYIGTSSSKAEMEVVAQQLEDIYIDVEVIIVDGATRQSRIEAGDFNMENESKGASFPDPDAFNDIIFHDFEDGGFNYTGWSSPEWKALHEQQVLAVTEETRAPFLQQMADILYEDAAYIGLVRPGLLQGHRANWNGWVKPEHHASNFTLENVWLSDA